VDRTARANRVPRARRVASGTLAGVVALSRMPLVAPTAAAVLRIGSILTILNALLENRSISSPIGSAIKALATPTRSFILKLSSRRSFQAFQSFSESVHIS